MYAPTKEQIDFVEEICEILGIDFPTCSEEFTEQTYYYFIADHINEYREAIVNNPICDEAVE